MAEPYDVAIVGAGPGGYVAAIRATQLGLRTALVERDQLGGVCLNRGCIPSKTLLHAAELLSAAREAEPLGITFESLSFDLGRAVERSREVVNTLRDGIDVLLKQNGVDLLRGEAKLVGPRELALSHNGDRVEAENIVLATGARPASLPGLTPDGDRIITSTEALALDRVPGRAIVIGGGPVGVEFAYLWSAAGAQVTILELESHLLPGEDPDVSAVLERSFNRRGIELRCGVRVEAAGAEGDGVTVKLAGGETVTADLALVATGIVPNGEGLGLEECGVEFDRGFVVTDGLGRTNVPGMWAIGDLTGRLPLAHVASAQGVAVAETIAGLDPPAPDMEWMPRAVYCQPQVASVGLTEAQARERGHDARVGRFPFRASGRALALDAAEGFTKLVFDGETHELLGAQIVGPEATELIAQASLGKLLETTAAEIGATVHPHPTLSESLKEAALALSGEAIHFFTPRTAVGGR